MTETELQQACDRFVHNEVKCCLSSLVSTLAKGCEGFGEVDELCAQAIELASPVDDYEEAVFQAGWEPYTDKFGVACWRTAPADDLSRTWAGDAESVCAEFDIDPYQREVFEHWAISSHLADALEAQGEKLDRDFAGLIVWARTTTGQAISMDHCIRTIVEKMHAAPVEG